MRKVTYGAAVSLDGYIAGRNEAMDWLRWSDDAAAIMRESWKGVDTMLIGRKTFDFGQRSGGGGPSGIKTYLFSRTMTEAPAGAELVREDAAGFVRTLKESEGGDIILMGGGELAAVLIEAGLVDDIGLGVHPLLLGGGAPMFPEMALRIELELIETRTIQHDCVLVRYRVAS